MNDFEKKPDPTSDSSVGPHVPTIQQLQQIFFLTFIWIFLWELVISATTLPYGHRMLLLTVLLPIPAFAILTLYSFPILSTYRLKYPGWKHLLLAIPIGLSATILVDGIDRIWVNLTGIEQTNIQKLYERLRTNDWFEFNSILLSAVLFAPITEELLFRGVLQGTLELRTTMNKAIVWTAVIFTILHFNFEQILSLWLFALLLGFLAWRVDSILPAIVVHIINNSLSFYVLQYRPDGSLFDGYLDQQFVAPIWFLSASVLWLLCVLFYFKFDQPLSENL